MSFNIKKKILSIVGKTNIKDSKYNYISEIKNGIIGSFISIISLSLALYYIYINNVLALLFDINPALGMMAHMLFAALIVLMGFSILIFIVFFLHNLFNGKNYFKKRKEIFKIEKELSNQFGSVDNAIKLYRKITNLNLELNDENFYKILNESDEDKNKINKIENISQKKLDRIEERINKLMKEKEKIKSKLNEKKGMMISAIEYKPVDISMDLSELKDRVIVGGLK